MLNCHFELNVSFTDILGIRASLSVCLSICPSVCLSVCLSACLPFFVLSNRYAESGTGPGNYEVCDGSGEDPQCSLGTLLSAEITDHLSYLDHVCTSCKPF